MIAINSKLGFHGLPVRDYSADGALSVEPQIAVLDGSSATCQTTIAAPGQEMIGKVLVIYASDVSNACDVDYTTHTGAATTTFSNVNNPLVLMGLTATVWTVFKAPA